MLTWIEKCKNFNPEWFALRNQTSNIFLSIKWRKVYGFVYEKREYANQEET